MVAVCPSGSGPTVRIFAAIPLEFVCADAEPETAMPEPADCQLIVWLAAGIPLVSAIACTVQVKVAPAASDSCGVSERRVGGVPPAKCACRLEPFKRDAVTTEGAESAAVTFMVAIPSPVATVEQTEKPQASFAFPLVTV